MALTLDVIEKRRADAKARVNADKDKIKENYNAELGALRILGEYLSEVSGVSSLAATDSPSLVFDFRGRKYVIQEQEE